MSRTYRVRGNDGGTRDFPQEAIWHLKGPSWCGWNGDLPAVRLAREAIGLALSSESSQSTLHRNGLQTTGVYSVTGNLSQEKYQMLRAWIERQALPENRFRPMLLDLDAKFTPTTMKGVDAEHLATRKMQIEEVCRAFGVFPQMVGHGGDQAPTFASAEQFFIAHVVHTLMPLYQDVEQSIDVNLIGKDDPTFAKFTVDGLMRGAMVDRFNAYAQALGSGGSPAWMTPNEVRGLQEMNPLEGGDELPKPAAAAPAPAKPEGGGNGSS
jgi:HK97 family phage portal protein